ncbi:hypothetical protein [Nonomuraea sp. NEAU-A123]|uniref:hypothetical protein n=1 Tax=Nonomuraea sp. NEAU-A123 TaxID=2839649 RepID=UPI001BE497B8|nr:hypothetical protein [Nonomuraea sp. NEAU-A123]MBT2229862.1 hypothetical protein [Nonomuraea sp. NEAU-A123]
MRLHLRALVGLATLAGAFLLSTPVPAQAALTTAGTYRGEGDDVVRIPATSKPSIVKLTHQGDSNFAVWTLTTSGKQVDLLANAIGDYKGTAAFNVNGLNKIRSLSVTADGAWTLQVLPISKARYWTINAKGSGSDVLRLTTASKGLRRLTIRHSGESNFAVWALDNRGQYLNLLVNKIGTYKGRVVLPSGTRYATVTADGAWTISRG